MSAASDNSETFLAEIVRAAAAHPHVAGSDAWWIADFVEMVVEETLEEVLHPVLVRLVRMAGRAPMWAVSDEDLALWSRLRRELDLEDI